MSLLTRRFFLESLTAGSVATKEMLARFPDRMSEGINPSNVAMPPSSAVTKVFENDFVRLDLDPRNGNFLSLISKRKGRNYISHPQYARSFRLVYWGAERLSTTFHGRFEGVIESSRQREPKITFAESHGERRLEVSYPSLLSEYSELPISFHYTLLLAKDSDEIVYQARLSNRSKHLITEVFFPWISGIDFIENKETDQIVFCNSKLNVKEVLGNGYSNGWFPGKIDIEYPSVGYDFQVPWVHYGGDKEGLYIASKDRTSEHHRFYLANEFEMKSFDKQKMIYSVAWNFGAYINPGKDWESPESILVPHQGDWHDAADRFRETLKTWYQMPDTPRWFKESLGSANLVFRRSFDELVEMAEDAKQYGITDVNTWQQDMHYPRQLDKDDPSHYRIGIVEDDFGGLEKLRAANEKVRAMGMNPMVIFNARLWATGALDSELREKAEKWTIRGWDGTAEGAPRVEHALHSTYGAAYWAGATLPGLTFGLTTSDFSWRFYMMCPAVKQYRDFAINSVVAALRQTKYQSHFFDQSSNSYLCFSPQHQHASPKEASSALPLMMKELKESMRANDPNAMLIGEGTELVATQYCDLNWTWNNWGFDVKQNYWPEIQRYTLPWIQWAISLDDNWGLANKYFVLGIYLALFTRNYHSTSAKLSEWPEFALHIKKLARLRKLLADFMVDGQFKDDVGMRSTNAFARIYQRDERLAVLVAELEGRAQQVEILLDGERYKIQQKPAQCERIDLTGERHVHPFRVEKEGRIRVQFPLTPWEIQVLIFSRNAAA